MIVVTVLLTIIALFTGLVLFVDSLRSDGPLMHVAFLLAVAGALFGVIRLCVGRAAALLETSLPTLNDEHEKPR